MILIGLSGYARSGKDSIAAVLVQHYGFQRKAFADTLRNALIALNPTLLVNGEPYPLATAVQCWGWEKLKEIAPDSRLYLQRLGTEVGRDMLGENIWVDLTLDHESTLLNDIVVTDCRFLNEARKIKSLGGFLVKVERPGVGPVNNHASDAGLDVPFDYYLINDGTLDDLNDDVAAMLLALAERRETQYAKALSDIGIA